MTLRLNRILLWTALFLVLGLIWRAGAQTATAPQFSAPFALPGETARKTSVVVIDAPLTVTRDAATGFVHVSLPVFIVDLPLTVNMADDGVTKRVGITLPQFYRIGVPAPLIGSPCSGTQGLIADRSYVYICVPPADPVSTPPDPATPTWTWAAAALVLTPPAAAGVK